MLKILVLFGVLFVGQSSFAQEELAPFETDFCTGYIEGTLDNPEAWKLCCVEHDMFFWAGGSKEDRKKADLNLRACVEESGHPKHAALIYYSVRLGSYSPIKFSGKKWNFGWPFRPTHQELSNDDLDQIEDHLFTFYPSIPLDFKQNFIFKLRTR